MTFKDNFAKVLRILVMGPIVALLFFYTATSQSAQRMDITTDPNVDRAALMMQDWDCWNGGDNRPVPHHVILIDETGEPMVWGQHQTDLALDAVFHGDGELVNGWKVYAFCR